MSETPQDPGPVPVRLGPITLVLSVISAAASILWWKPTDLSRFVLVEGTLTTEPWRLLTSALLHMGMPHLAFNLLLFVPLGSRVERAFGPLFYAALVVVLAAASGAAEYATGTPSVGLSGIVYGFWTFLYFAQHTRPELRNVLTPKFNQTMAMWFVLCIVFTWANAMNVANLAHAVGAGVGAIVGRIVLDYPKRHTRWIAALALSLALIASAALFGRPYFSVLSGARSEVARASALIQSGRLSEAIPLLERAVAEAPSDERLWRSLVGVYIEVGRFDSGLDTIYRAVDARPSLRAELGEIAVWIHREQARSLEWAADFAAAYDHARAALEWDRESTELLLLAAWYAQSAGDRDAAIRYCRAAERDPRVAEEVREILGRLEP